MQVWIVAYAWNNMAHYRKNNCGCSQFSIIQGLEHYVVTTESYVHNIVLQKQLSIML